MKGLKKSGMALGLLVLVGCASTPEGSATGGAAVSASPATMPESSGSAGTMSAGEMGSSTLAAFYSDEQAVRGEEFFRQTCLSCHSSSEFSGSTFEGQWAGRTVRDLYSAIAYSMPDDNPGGLPAQTYTDIIAYVLALNGYPSGGSELTPDRTAMRSMDLWPDA